jgi:hypothetical protein
LCLDHLTPAQARAFMIADNRPTEIATWDDRFLAEQLKDLSLLGLDFSLETTGFEIGEIDLRIASLDVITTTRPMPCPKSQPGHPPARSAISGSSVGIASCAATLSIPRPS